MLKLIINKHHFIQFLIVYYWICAYIFGIMPEFQRFSVQYFIIVLPIVFFIIINYQYLLGVQSSRTLVLWVFLSLTLIISILRFDINTIFTFFLLFSTIIILQNGEFHIKLKLINTLFIAAIFVSILLYHFGFTMYGYFPGQTNYVNVDIHNEKWRISLFPLLLDSGFFSMIVIFSNYYFNKNLIGKVILIGLATYFLIFTGIRTTFIISLLFIVFIVIRNIKNFQTSYIYIVLNWVFLFIVISSLIFTFFILHIANKSDNAFVNTLLFRSSSNNISADDLRKTIVRAWIWEEHLRLFSENPLVGIGSFEFDEVVAGSLEGQKGSESPLTGFFARIGISAILVIVFFAMMWNNSIRENKPYSYFISFVILSSLLTYGSYFNPYNFIFLLFFTSYNNIT